MESENAPSIHVISSIAVLSKVNKRFIHIHRSCFGGSEHKLSWTSTRASSFHHIYPAKSPNVYSLRPMLRNTKNEGCCIFHKRTQMKQISSQRDPCLAQLYKGISKLKPPSIPSLKPCTTMCNMHRTKESPSFFFFGPPQ